MQYINNNQMISMVPVETLQGKREFLCKVDQNEKADVRWSHLYVTKDGRVKTVRIMVIVGENLVSIDKDKTSQPLQTAHQHTWWYSQATPQTYASSSANSMQSQTYKTYSFKRISGFQDSVSNTVNPQFTKLFCINLWPGLVYLQKTCTNILSKKNCGLC
jgi:hypothetical protein